MYRCKACTSNIIDFFSLGRVPLVNSFLVRTQLSKEKKYELTIAFCPNCYLVQLTKIIPPEKLFTDYIYLSSVSKTIVEHSKKTSEYLTKRLRLTSKSLVIDIGSNDGILLHFFKQLGVKILGVDPARNIAKIANERGIRTIPELFNYKFAKKLEKKGIKADLVFGSNVLGHVPKIVDFVKGISLILDNKGTAVFEFPYLKGLFENKFDIIYHEHVFYYSLIALQNLFKRANLDIYDLEIIDTQGGSLRIFACHHSTFPIKRRVTSLVKKELIAGFDKIITYKIIDKNIKKIRRDLVSLLSKLKNKGKKIAAYSAPAKGNILLNYFGIGQNLLEFIVDKAKSKQGLYTPGTHMQVYPLDAIDKKKPDYLLVLCWNIYEEVVAMEELKNFREGGGKFIIPIPKIKIL